MLDFATSTGPLTEAGQNYMPMSVGRFGNPISRGWYGASTKFQVRMIKYVEVNNKAGYIYFKLRQKVY